MNKKLITVLIVSAFLCIINPISVQAGITPGKIYEADQSIFYRNVTVYAPAVASTDSGYVGVISTITVTIQSNGSGRVFVDTLPLTQVDMQGSARLAVKVASALVQNDNNSNINPSNYDYFFVVRTDAPIIGGPSAGGIMTVATISLLENWDIDNKTVMTGMINPDGSIGPIGGINQKIDAAHSVGAKRFLIPKGQGTYTDIQTVTDNNGWTRAIPVTKNVADYAMDNYGIEVVEVAEVSEAVENFTGYSFEYEQYESQITTEDYIESMKPLATTLLEEAKTEYKNAQDLFNNSSIPNSWPNLYRDDVEESLTSAKQKLEESENWFDIDIYYTSTSKSFQSLISSRFVKYVCEYFNANDENENTEFIINLLNSTEMLYNEKSELAKTSDVDGFISLQCIGAAQGRVTEAKQYLDSAKAAFEKDHLTTYYDIMDFLYNIAFTVERCKSIGWWVGIGDHFNETGNIDNSTLENLALEYIEDAQQSAIYSGIILDQMGKSSAYLTNAEELLDSARENLDSGYAAAALFEALEGSVKANLAIETIGMESIDKINMTKEKANSRISKSRRLGIEPVLAVSYYEYAESLTNESSYDTALIYYKYSSMIAGVLSFTNVTIGSSQSKYIGVPEYKEIIDYETVNQLEKEFIIRILIAICGLIAGLGLGLMGNSLFKEKREEKQSNDEKSNYPENPYFVNKNDTPKSIKDYYNKKNK